ncbi:hypothetical protein [Salinispora oceanensis]|uniref:hypothetical protein n=1 Tax=Salinispora oceanensis TaxID=1050199 RepID=UPI000381B17E|nr:hypothetical protein [Salinispora oceanensis]
MTWRDLVGCGGFVVAVYPIVRALVQPFVIDIGAPASCPRLGGPTLAGVLLVHCGPGLSGVADSALSGRAPQTLPDHG